jgi:dimethylargininase
MLTALTKAPAPSLVNCELTYLTREPIHFERARQQHQQYCAALEAGGARVITLPADGDQPDSVFVEDAAVIFDEVAVVTPLGVESRRAEAERLEPEIARFRPTVRIAPPALIEGGDVLRMGKTVYAGLSSRTGAAGVEALRRVVAPYGYEVVTAPVSGCLHLKTGCTALDDNTLLVNPEWVDVAPFHGRKIVPVAPDEPWAANVLRLGSSLVVNAAFPQTMRAVEQRGHRVRPVDISEFMKAEAGLTCLSLLFE